MLSAVIFGLIGIFSTAFLARQLLDWEYSQIIQSIISSNVAGLLSLLLILKAERTKWVRRRFLTRSRYTWPVFSGLYFSFLIFGSPFLVFSSIESQPKVNFMPLVLLVLPLIFSTGFAIIVFGPIQVFLCEGCKKK